MVSSTQSAPKFTAIWQAREGGTDWPLYHWVLRLFEPYISNIIYDQKHEVVMDNAIVFDAWVYANNPEYYKKFKGKNAFLVHIGDEFYELGVDRYVNFRGVFRMIWASVFNPKHVMSIPLGTYLHKPPASVLPATERRYAWSFIGDAGKVSRPDAVHAMSSIEPHICFSSTPVSGITFYNRNAAGKRRIPTPQFYEILGDSIFAPSPMGNASIESCRPYDALEMGAIPIVEKRLTLDYYKGLLGDHPLPVVSSWAEARRLVKSLINEPARLAELQQTCLQWWASYQAKLIANIGSFLEERSNSSDDLVPLRSSLPNMPYWQYFELLRHHNVPALTRRVTRQVSRLVRDRKWSVRSVRQGAKS
jgi:hypothetical protein